MKITKLGHCCLLVEVKGLRILTDPGTYSTLQNEQKNIDVVLITHEHADHLHVDSLKIILKHSPSARVITNAGVSRILQQEKIPHELVRHGQHTTIQTVLIEGIGEQHAPIYKTIAPVENTGYFIDETFFYPGDAFTVPTKHVTILALPVAGPWLKLSDAVDYALKVKPDSAFPVHDGMLQSDKFGLVHLFPAKVLADNNIRFVLLHAGDSHEFKY